MGYSPERKEAVLKKMLPPNNMTIAALAEAEGISEPTLYAWRKQARNEGRLMPDSDNTPEGWTSRDKFAAVLETAAMNEAELAAWCRNKGLYVEQIKQWRDACEQANDRQRESRQEQRAQSRSQNKQIKQLEKELSRKEKALAEAAALLVLRKKLAAMYQDNEDDS